MYHGAAEAQTLLHSYLRIRAVVRDAVKDSGVSEPRGSPASLPRNKDAQSTASLKLHFKSVKQLKAMVQPSQRSPVRLPTAKETLPPVVLCRQASSETQPNSSQLLCNHFFLHESFTPHPSPHSLDLRAQSMETVILPRPLTPISSKYLLQLYTAPILKEPVTCLTH